MCVCVPLRHKKFTIYLSREIKMKTYIYKEEKQAKNIPWMITEALCIVAQNWKQTKCPSIGKWTNRLWYIHSLKYYSAIKRNLLIIPSHVRISKTLFEWQSQKSIYCVIFLCKVLHQVMLEMMIEIKAVIDQG